MKRAANYIKRLATPRESSNSDIDESVRVPHKKRVKTGVIPNRNQQEIPYLGYVITRKSLKPDVQGIMDLGWPTAKTYAQALIVMVQYYRDMWPRRYHLLAPLSEAASVLKGRNILWNDALESSSKELKCMVYVETLLSHPDCTIPFTFHTDVSDKQVGVIISHK